MCEEFWIKCVETVIEKKKKKGGGLGNAALLAAACYLPPSFFFNLLITDCLFHIGLWGSGVYRPVCLVWLMICHQSLAASGFGPVGSHMIFIFSFSNDWL